MKYNYTEINSKGIDKWTEDGWIWGKPITHEEYVNAQHGQWSVLLTPSKPVPPEWFAPFLNNRRLENTKILGLACGGGQQMPIFAALGATCTVLDNSAKMLGLDKMVSEREGYNIDIIKADMTLRLPFESETFDMVFHPVSNCYIEDVRHVWRECFRILKKGGVLLAGMDNGLNYLVDDENPLLIVNKLPYNPLKDEALFAKNIAVDGTIQFSHTVEEQVGGQLKAGFTLDDLYEDSDNEGIGEYVSNFIATRALK